MKIAIVGGSIAGLTVSIGLSKLGHDVHIFERSPGLLEDRGAGITLPRELLKSLQHRKMIDQNMHNTVVERIRVFIQDAAVNDEKGRMICTLDAQAAGVNWAELYAQLNDHLSSEKLHFSVTIRDFEEVENGVALKVNGVSELFDLLIACDGYKSSFRSYVAGVTEPEFSGYLLWRGLISPPEGHEGLCEYAKESGFENIIFDEGHLVSYRICDVGLAKPLLNWAIYEMMTDEKIKLYMTDGKGQRISSIPRGRMSEQQLQHVYDLAQKHLPPLFADMILNTKDVYMQGIYDMNVIQYVRGRVCVLGDAATLVRPHTGSGSTKAMQDAMALIDQIEKNDNLDRALSNWQKQQLNKGNTLYNLGRALGKFLIEADNDWQSMSSNEYQKHIADLAKKYNWYLTEK